MLLAIVGLHAASSGLEVRGGVRSWQDDGEAVVESLGNARGEDADAARRVAALIVVMNEQQQQLQKQERFER